MALLANRGVGAVETPIGGGGAEGQDLGRNREERVVREAEFAET